MHAEFEKTDGLSKNLVIVESPAKAKTIEKFLGEGYVVKSSYGHVRDLPSKDLSVDVEKNFEPTYEIPNDKQDLVKELAKDAKKAETVWLATDEDREGEAISWHLREALDLEPSKIKRITFHEITKTAIQKAIESPRKIDEHLVDAQQARRVLDRLVGYELSPILWRKVKPSLSAGRVQSVAVRLIVEREREILNFNGGTYFRVTGVFTTEKGESLKAELPKRFVSEEEATAFLEDCLKGEFTVGKVDKKPGTRKPAPPFTTSTLQQEASRKLGYAVARTMMLAQRLYEAGHITYMRTDSVNLSDLALNESKDAITRLYGENFAERRTYTSKSKGAQEAHEAIRPTNLNAQNLEVESDQKRLYDLIWKRTIASQMANAQLERTTIGIDISTNDLSFQAKGEVITFEGFLKVYMEGKDDDSEAEEMSGVLPAVQVSDPLSRNGIIATQRFERPPARFSEAALVKKLEELGIGRPSTYAPTISTVQKRDYVVKESREGTPRNYRVIELNGAINAKDETENTGVEKGKLFPTDIGMVVNDFLVEHFPNVVDLNFTANVEEEFDAIAEGKLDWRKMLKNFYKPFHDTIEHTAEHAERAKGERHLGEDPVSGRPVFARIGRFGPMIQIGTNEDEEKPKFASLRKNQSIATITYEEAMELFKLPRDLGEYEGEIVQANIGRFGPYVRFGKLFVSLKEDDPMTVELPRAIELIKEKQEIERKRVINVWEEEGIKVLNGRYGPYVTDGKKNVTIPKDQEPKELTLEQCQKMIAEAPEKRRRGAKKTTAKKATKKKATKKKSTKKKSTTKKASGKK